MHEIIFTIWKGKVAQALPNQKQRADIGSVFGEEDLLGLWEKYLVIDHFITYTGKSRKP